MRYLGSRSGEDEISLISVLMGWAMASAGIWSSSCPDNVMITFWRVQTSKEGRRNNLFRFKFKEQTRLYYVIVGIVVTRVNHWISRDNVFRIQIRRVRDDTPRPDMFPDSLLFTAVINNAPQLLQWLGLTISKPAGTRPAVFHFHRLQTTTSYGTPYHKFINHNNP